MDLGPNVIVFDSTMTASSVQTQCDNVFAQQGNSQFGTTRKALLFKPGSFSVDVHVGFYTQVLGLGASPDDVQIAGAVRSTAYLGGGNATCNFWRGCENLAVTPTGGTNLWAVAQATPFRRMHIKGNMTLSDTGETPWSSGGFISDSRIDGTINSGSQQQWISRSSEFGTWQGANWNMVFVGVTNPPAGEWPDPPYTKVDKVPVVREKPFLTYSDSDGYRVFVPALRQDTSGTTWSSATPDGTYLPLSAFYIAKEGDSAATLNAALSQGKHLLITPGIYTLNQPLQVEKPNTLVLGLGFATLKPTAGNAAMTIADVDGVKIAGLLIDAGATNSSVLMEVGPANSSVNHSANPTSLHDVFFRIGGAGTGKADVSLRINSRDVIGDQFWIWRADHGDSGVGWNVNTAANGLVVNGDDVTIYGLFVEHYQRNQTTWNGNGGRVYFYQSEIPYDVPDQATWMDGTSNGFASYKVADTVTSHEAWGLGIYSFFSANGSVKLANAIETPTQPEVKIHNMVTVCLGNVGEITHIINDNGGAVNSGNMVSKLAKDMPIYAIKASNGKFACADNYGNSPLIANRDAAGGWEQYALIANSDGTISLQAMVNSLYVTVNSSKGNQLIASKASIGNAEKFKQVTQGNGTVALQSLANNLYVTLKAADSILYATATSITGSEQFTLTK